MSQRNARIGRSGNGAGHAGDFLERHARVGQGFGFLAASAENVGIAPFEPGHHLAFFGLVHQQSVDVGLRHGVVAGYLAHVDAFRVGPGVGHESVAGQIVVDHHVRLGKRPQAFAGDQTRIAGARAYEINVHPASLRADRFSDMHAICARFPWSVLPLKISAGQDPVSGPQFSHLHRSYTPQMSCGCSDAAPGTFSS